MERSLRIGTARCRPVARYHRGRAFGRRAVSTESGTGSREQAARSGQREVRRARVRLTASCRRLIRGTSSSAPACPKARPWRSWVVRPTAISATRPIWRRARRWRCMTNWQRSSRQVSGSGLAAAVELHPGYSSITASNCSSSLVLPVISHFSNMLVPAPRSMNE